MGVTMTNLSRRLLLGTAITGLGTLACGRPREYGVSNTATIASTLPPGAAVPLVHPDGGQPDGRLTASPDERGRCALTADNIEGPFFRAGAPRRAVLADATTKGTKLTLSGRVLDARCRPIPEARIEIWHADHAGAYDNDGFGFRATVDCDEHGAYALQSIIPGRYLNGDRYRPAHLHLKLSAPKARPLTTQLYFAGDPYNAGDPFIRKSLIMSLSDTPWGKAASYDIVLG